MWLTKNEKQVLKLLLDNGKLSDTYLAKTLNISSQAVGRIRKVLEEDIIQKYSIELNPKMLGINIITISKINIDDPTTKNVEMFESIMLKEISNICILKMMVREGYYEIISGFKSIDDLNKIINDFKCSLFLDHKYSIMETNIIPLNYLLKNSGIELAKKFIDSCGTKHTEIDK